MEAKQVYHKALKRLEGLIPEPGTDALAPQMLGEIETLGRVILQLNDVVYRETHTSSASSPAHENMNRRKRGKKK